MLQNKLINLSLLHSSHQGKVSDKWNFYLNEYDKLFFPYQEKPIRLLEIGIQNGGSLEVLAKYFKNARNILGCDIDPKCTYLEYDDDRIKVLIGNAANSSCLDLVAKHTEGLDIIIDDGSHKSADIVKSFCLFFPCLTDGGIYVVEDLHCSYWHQYSGGLCEPHSAIEFFKALADIINYEHWGAPAKREYLLQTFFDEHECFIDEFDLEHLHSIEFLNSMCVIRKQIPSNNILGQRRVVGSIESIMPGILFGDGKYITVPEQLYLSMPSSLVEKYTNLIGILTYRDSQIEELNVATNVKDACIEELNVAMNVKDACIEELNLTILDILNSFSWRICKPARIGGTYIKKILTLVNRLFMVN